MIGIVTAPPAQANIAQALTELRALERDANQRVRMLDREIADFVLAPLMQELVDEVGRAPGRNHWKR